MIEGNILKQGAVEVEVDPSSLVNTDERVKRLDSATVDALAEAYGVKIGRGQPPSAKLIMVRSHVQMEWHGKFTEGGVPMAAAKNHMQREEQIKNAAGAGEPTGAARQDKTPRPDPVFKVADMTEAQKAEWAKVRGQRQIVFNALVKAGGKATAEQVAKVIAEGGEPYPSKDTVINSVKYHLKGLKDGGYVTTVQQDQAAAA